MCRAAPPRPAYRLSWCARVAPARPVWLRGAAPRLAVWVVVVRPCSGCPGDVSVPVPLRPIGQELWHEVQVTKLLHQRKGKRPVLTAMT